MTHRSARSTTQVAAVLVLAGAGAAAWTGLAQATGAGSHGISRVEEANVRVDDPIRIKEKEGAQVIVSHITVAPRGHTPWHYHPGPHFVSVRSGTVVVYETDCSSTSYPAGTGFFDPGDTRREHLHVHTLLNPSEDVPAEVVITDVRSEDLRPTVAVDPQPAACFS
jgi:quercetin dioxygenase-like cupin family protein